MHSELHLLLTRNRAVEPAELLDIIGLLSRELGSSTVALARRGAAPDRPASTEKVGLEALQWDAVLILFEESVFYGMNCSRLYEAIDPSLSTVAVGRRHTILPVTGHLQQRFVLRRTAMLTQAAFHDYWLNAHARFGRQLLPPRGYHQIHVEEIASRNAARRMGFSYIAVDGIGEVHFPEGLAPESPPPDAALVQQARADERIFVDKARSHTAVYGAC